jgi:hypothetical protein
MPHSQSVQNTGQDQRRNNALHPELIPLLQFFTNEITPLPDGKWFVGVHAVLAETDGEQSLVEMISQRADNHDEAMRLISEATSVAIATRAMQ